jgi:hypothetical protein
MSEYFVIIFGYNYEGECAQSMRLFKNLDEVDNIVAETQDDNNYDYYRLGTFNNEGKVNLMEGCYSLR